MKTFDRNFKRTELIINWLCAISVAVILILMTAFAAVLFNALFG